MVLLRCLLGGSWGLLRRLGRLFGALGWFLRPLDRLLGSLESLLEPPGVLLAASWSLFGCSWGGLGATGAPLGSSRSRSQTAQIHHAQKDQLQVATTHLLRDMAGGFWRANPITGHLLFHSLGQCLNQRGNAISVFKEVGNQD